MLYCESNHAERTAVLWDILAEQPGNSARNQRARILAALHANGFLTSLECSRCLGIVHPPKRVHELRQMGIRIATQWSHEPSETGELHRVGLYVRGR
ncbi:MAG: helix-turn-helix domain-containing protein [Pseudomonadota bacterium]